MDPDDPTPDLDFDSSHEEQSYDYTPFAEYFGIPEPATPEDATRLMLDAAAGTVKVPRVLELMKKLTWEKGADTDAVDEEGNTVPLLLIKSGQIPAASKLSDLHELQLFDWMHLNTHHEYAALEYMLDEPSAHKISLLVNSGCNVNLRKLSGDLEQRISAPPPRGEDPDPTDPFSIYCNEPPLERLSRLIYPSQHFVREFEAARQEGAAADFLLALSRKDPNNGLAGSYEISLLVEGGSFSAITAPTIWKGREKELAEVVAAMPVGWRERMRGRPEIQHFWQRCSDMLSYLDPLNANELLDEQGHANFRLMTLAKHGELKDAFSEGFWKGSASEASRVINALAEISCPLSDETIEHFRHWSLAKPQSSVTVKYILGAVAPERKV